MMDRTNETCDFKLKGSTFDICQAVYSFSTGFTLNTNMAMQSEWARDIVIIGRSHLPFLYTSKIATKAFLVEQLWGIQDALTRDYIGNTVYNKGRSTLPRGRSHKAPPLARSPSPVLLPLRWT